MKRKIKKILLIVLLLVVLLLAVVAVLFVISAVIAGLNYASVQALIKLGNSYEKVEYENEFELLERENLLKEYPQHELIIKRLTK